MTSMTSAEGAADASAHAVRVLEWGGGVSAAYAGWLLASLGAQVERVAGPQPGIDPLGLALSALATGKAQVEAPRDQAGLDERLRGVDVLLCDDRRSLEAVAGPLADLGARHPGLILGVASTFGLEGPCADHPGVGLDAQALGSVAWALGEADRPPLALPPGVVEHEGGAVLAAGALMALIARDRSGVGTVVDVALADVMASYVAGNCRFYIHHGLTWRRSGRRASDSGGAYPFAILPCADGEVCVCGRTRDEWKRLMRVMGDPPWSAEPRYQDLRAMGRRYPDEVDALVKPWFAERTMDELEALALENNLIVSPVRDLLAVLATPGFIEDGFLRSQEVAGQQMRVPGLPFRVHAARASGAPDLAATLLKTAAPARLPTAPTARPMEGVRVLDFGWVWSAPWVGTMLGELGAEVIKVEHTFRPDTLRLSGRVIRDGEIVEGPTHEMSPMFHQVNHGKLGVTANTKEPRAVELLLQLAAKSDVVIENMSPGAMERSGLGFETLRAANPRLVMLSMSAAGQFGALAAMRAYAPTMSSFAGMEALVGYPGEAATGALNVALGDPNASVHGLLALLAALRRARLTGEGAFIDLSQIEALVGVLRPYLLQAQREGGQPAALGSRHPTQAPHGIYPSEGANQWLTLAVEDDRQWAALASVAKGEAWAADPWFKASAGRLRNVGALDAAVAGWTAREPRDALVSRLRAAGIASSPVLSIEEMWADPHFAARRLKASVRIPHYGDEDVFRAPWRFAGFEPQIDRSGPTLGEHNDYVFGELLGLPRTEIEELVAQGVLR